MKKIYHRNVNQKKVCIAIFTSDKYSSRQEYYQKLREHAIMTKESIHQEDPTIVNAYTPNNRASKHMKQKLTQLRREINSQSQMNIFN